MHRDFDSCYRAVSSRDACFDGRVFTAVLTTGIYCRPSCPARTPLPENVRFYPSAAAAVAAGFRACKRCRPDALPGSREWDHRSDLVARALRLIAAGEVDERGIPGLAARLAVSERHLHRLLTAEVGVGALSLARTRRAQTARLLIDQTALSMADVAFASGFASIRQFNDVMRQEFGCPPGELRRRAPAESSNGQVPGNGGLVLRLVHRVPYAAEPLLDWLRARAIPGVEECGATTYRRVIRTTKGAALVEVEQMPEAGHVVARLSLADLGDLQRVVGALRQLFDLDADPQAVDDVLGADPVLQAGVRACPGIRVPGTVDGFELAVRAVLGQQVSVPAARTFAARLAERYGEPLPEVSGSLAHAFPDADTLAEADFASIGLTGRRRETLRELALAVANGKLVLDPGADREDVRRQLIALPGIGSWTAEYVAMRALADPDAWPASDLVLKRTVERLAAQPNKWRPWRAYAAMHLYREETP